MKFISIKLIIFSMILALVAPAFVYAADLTNASLELSDPRPDETSVSYTFTASGWTTGTTINCVTLEFNDQADMGGSVPNSMSTSGFNLSTSTVLTAASWVEDDTTNGVLENTFAGGETPSASGNIVFTGIENGDTSGTTYFAQLNTYSNVDCSTGGPVDTVTVAFVFQDGEPVQLTVDPTLTITCVGVGSSQSVNSATTTVATSCTGIDFGTTVTTSANGISAHDIQATTNAQGGYTLDIRHTGDLTNAGSATIDNHSGTNGSPTAFTAAGTEGWGYTTDDSTLGGGTADRFTSAGGDKWAGFTASNEIVGDLVNATPTTQTHRVGHQVGIAADTDAGTYQTTIIYTAIATF